MSWACRYPDRWTQPWTIGRICQGLFVPSLSGNEGGKGQVVEPQAGKDWSDVAVAALDCEEGKSDGKGIGEGKEDWGVAGEAK